MEEKIGLISDENTRLHDKIGELETENMKLRTNIEMTQYRMDSMDENVSNNVSVSVDLWDKTRDLNELVDETRTSQNEIIDKTRELYELVEETRTSQDKINDKVNSHRKMQLELGDAYYQFIMGNTTKHGVKRRLSDAGYLETKKIG